ncbi:hypothetical protein [Okeania sp.]|uniref:hypothetical protein n=1 Tax=Okeania sp. TaxID=3100323 RepID=UPI002B4AD47F|nr:hypothetical protein [Okeania sp.]
MGIIEEVARRIFSLFSTPFLAQNPRFLIDQEPYWNHPKAGTLLVSAKAEIFTSKHFYISIRQPYIVP